MCYRINPKLGYVAWFVVYTPEMPPSLLFDDSSYRQRCMLRQVSSHTFKFVQVFQGGCAFLLEDSGAAMEQVA